MHEAGIAARVVEALRSAGAEDSIRPVRLVVSGGHGEHASFDAALRLHLSAQLPALRAPIEITHAAEPTICTACLRPYLRAGDGPCPACGGEGLPISRPETIEVEIEDEEDQPCA
jgi:Zn finger protein HypA/HybF involved in hydrogenase expression